MEHKRIRKLKIYNTSGYRYKSTPTIILKGNWLLEIGFEIGNQIEVKCEKERIEIVKE